jgi:hypothetical protein
MKKKLFWVFGFLCVLSVLFLGYNVYKFIKFNKIENEKLNDFVKEKTVKTVVSLAKYMSKIIETGKYVADVISSSQFDEASLLKFIKKSADESGISVGVAYKYYKFDPSKKLWSHFIVKDSFGKSKIVKCNYDYTKSRDEINVDTDWYTKIINSDGWSEPYLGTTSKEMNLTHGTRFYSYLDKDKKDPIGQVSTEIVLDDLKDTMHDVFFENFGYGIIVSDSGKYVSHPNEKILRNLETIYDENKRTKSTLIKELKKVVKQKENKSVHFNILREKNKTIIFCAKRIPKTKLTLVSVYDKSGPFNNKNASIINEFKIRIIVAVILFLIFLCTFFIIPYLERVSLLIVYSALVSFLLFCGSLFMCVSEYLRIYSSFDIGEVPIFSRNYINHVVESSQDSVREIAVPSRVKTGILITNLYTTNIRYRNFISGYLWQRYPLILDEEVKKDFIFANCYKLEEKSVVLNKITKKEKIIIWFFKGLFDNKDNLSLKKYPLDTVQIMVLIGSKSINDRVILVPDILGYELINPSVLPGIIKNKQISEFTFLQSYFSFKPTNLEISPGIKNFQMTVNKYYLSFKVNMSRHIFDLVIGYFLLIIIILIILFINLLIVDKSRIAANISIVAGTLLGIVLQHSAFRKMISSTRFCYMDYFFVLLYFVDVLLLLNFMIYSSKLNVKFIEYKKNFLPKILFFPIVFLYCFIISVVTFYG